MTGGPDNLFGGVSRVYAAFFLTGGLRDAGPRHGAKPASRSGVLPGVSAAKREITQ